MASIIAVIFDFDDTLVPDSTTKLLKSHGFDTELFWQEDVRNLVESGYDNTLAWLRLLLENVGSDKRLGLLTNQQLYEFGGSLDEDFFEGLPELFDDLTRVVSQDFRDISIEFYIISSGLRQVILGSEIVRKYFTDVFGCELGEGEDGSTLQYIKRCVTFTEKTRHLFEINKGITFEQTKLNPLLVNTDIDLKDRRIPFENMIYLGDGQTDIPCFSLLNHHKSFTFGIFDPARKAKAKQALLKFLQPHRVLSMHAPRYGEDDELGSLLRQAVATRCSQLSLRQEQAYGSD